MVLSPSAPVFRPHSEFPVSQDLDGVSVGNGDCLEADTNGVLDYAHVDMEALVVMDPLEMSVGLGFPEAPVSPDGVVTSSGRISCPPQLVWFP